MFERVKHYLEENWGFHFHKWQYTDKPPMAITPSSERHYWFVMECANPNCYKERYELGWPTQEMIDDFNERNKK